MIGVMIIISTHSRDFLSIKCASSPISSTFFFQVVAVFSCLFSLIKLVKRGATWVREITKPCITPCVSLSYWFFFSDSTGRDTGRARNTRTTYKQRSTAAAMAPVGQPTLTALSLCGSSFIVSSSTTPTLSRTPRPRWTRTSGFGNTVARVVDRLWIILKFYCRREKHGGLLHLSFSRCKRSNYLFLRTSRHS